MGNMGVIPAVGYESSVVQTFSSPTGTSHTMTYAAGVNDMVLVINNVIQEPTVAYTTSGTTLTTDTLVSGDTMYIIFLALTRQTVAPGADTVTSAMIVDNAIDSEHYTDASIDLAHMSVNSIDSDQYVDASIDNAHLADDAVGVAELSATGTASSSTFLRGDNSWTAVSTPITALNNATANELVTVGATTTELDAESLLTFNAASDPPLLYMEGAMELRHSGDAPRNITFDANRGAAGDSLGDINFQWNNTTVAKIAARAGVDTTNKDDANLAFYVTASGGSIGQKMILSHGGVLGVGADPNSDLGVGLHIRTADSGADVHTDADELVIEGSGHSGMTILS